MEGIIERGEAKGIHMPFKLNETITDINGAQVPFIKITDANGNSISLSNLTPNTKGVRKIDNTYTLKIAQVAKNPNGTIRNPEQLSRYRTKKIDNIHGHTFFPDNMGYSEIIEQFASALIDPNKKSFPTSFSRGTSWEATSESGLIFRWYMEGAKINSFFPKF